MKRLYEGMFLFDSNLAGRDWPGLEKHVQDLLGRHDAELEYTERWPDRKLSYEIKSCRKGTYYLTYFRAAPDEITGLHRDCELSDRVLRLLVLGDDSNEEFCEQRKRRDEEAEAKKAEAKKAEADKVEASTPAAPSAPAPVEAAPSAPAPVEAVAPTEAKAPSAEAPAAAPESESPA